MTQNKSARFFGRFDFGCYYSLMLMAMESSSRDFCSTSEGQAVISSLAFCTLGNAITSRSLQHTDQKKMFWSCQITINNVILRTDTHRITNLIHVVDN
ncbi:MAG: hypothetical protein IKL80_02220, partial [Clostridia bacterium]|nr:hypothetical protein [Clostridia bacterium]